MTLASDVEYISKSKSEKSSRTEVTLKRRARRRKGSCVQVKMSKWIFLGCPSPQHCNKLQSESGTSGINLPSDVFSHLIFLFLQDRLTATVSFTIFWPLHVALMSIHICHGGGIIQNNLRSFVTSCKLQSQTGSLGSCVHVSAVHLDEINVCCRKIWSFCWETRI